MDARELVDRATEAGATSFVAKPYTAADLLHALHDALHVRVADPSNLATPSRSGR